MGVVPFYTKTPAADFTIAMDFVDELPTDVTLASCACSARKERDETDATSTILAGGTGATIVPGSSVAAINVSGGTRGVMYEVLFIPTLSDGQVLPAVISRLMVDL